MLIFLAQLTLMMVFVVSAVAKFGTPEDTARAAGEFGVPPAVSPWLARLLPAVELAIAAALSPMGAPRVGGLLAALSLLLFTALVAWRVAQGASFDCNCFGRLRPAPIGWSTVARNAALLALALLTATFGGPPPDALQRWLTASMSQPWLPLTLWFTTLVAVFWTGGGLGRRLEGLGGRLDAVASRLDALDGRPAAQSVQPGLPVGAFAPPFRLPRFPGEPGGPSATLDELRASGRAVLLIFTHPGCGPCKSVLPALVDHQAAHAHRLLIVLLVTEQSEDPPAAYAQLTSLLDLERFAATAYQTPGVPCAALVRPNGTIGAPLAVGPRNILNLVDWTVDRFAAPPSQADAAGTASR